ncbi:IS701 family transposase [Streptomyces sp. NPDC005925]|uniref:IS701 family transposase n=1 Tax=Streptomyces sp. NPDC005925 TaxID=3157172 RepID=UPI0033CAED7D
MRAYVHGLLGPGGRKNSRQLAEHAGHPTPAGLRHLLGRACWNPDEVRDDLQEHVAERLGDPAGVLITDDTGFLKKGTVSAGVQRQYSGTAGRTENCRTGVFAAYASPKGRALVDQELYLPKSWTSDRDRCQAARIPEEREFATKGDLAKAMAKRALASPLPVAGVTADSAYGQERWLRRMLEEAGLGYVLAVPKSQHVHALGRIDFAIAQAPDDAWERHSCGNGAKGPRVYDWAAAQLPAMDDFDGDQPTHQRWVLARRSLARPDETAYYLAPDVVRLSPCRQPTLGYSPVLPCRTNAAALTPCEPADGGRLGRRTADRSRQRCTNHYWTPTELDVYGLPSNTASNLLMGLPEFRT